MLRYMYKIAIVLGLASTVLLSTASAKAGNTDIESLNYWPESPDHGDRVYIEAEVSEAIDTEKAFYEVLLDGEIIASNVLVDSNEDGFYVSPTSFKVSGDKEYSLRLKVCAPENCMTQKEEIYPSCGIDIVGRCIY